MCLTAMNLFAESKMNAEEGPAGAGAGVTADVAAGLVECFKL